MKKYRIIAPIKKEFRQSSILTMEKSLSSYNLTRIPSTGVYKFPYKEITGKYRTGLDPDALYIERIPSEEQRKLERERVSALREKLEKLLGVDLSPTSSFWNYKLAQSDEDTRHVTPVKLVDGNNYFDLNNPHSELSFAWLRVHPTIASSLQAYLRGEYPPDTQFYVVDDDIENDVKFKKKKEINDAITRLNEMTPEKKIKVARLLGLPVGDDTPDTYVYNMIDDFLKKSEVKGGANDGRFPATVFLEFASLDNKLLHVKDLVKQALSMSIVRSKYGGKIYRGDLEIAKSEEEYVRFLLDDDNQEELIMLQNEVKSKKSIVV